MSFFRRDASYYYNKAAKLLPKDPARTLKYFEKSAQLSNGEGMFYYNIAECLTRESSNQPALRTPALRYIDSAIQLLPQSHPFFDASHVLRGNLRARVGMMGEALSDYNKAAELRPDNPEVYYRRGLVYWRCGDLECAEDDLTKAVSLIGGAPPFAIMLETALAQLKKGGPPVG